MKSRTLLIVLSVVVVIAVAVGGYWYYQSINGGVSADTYNQNPPKLIINQSGKYVGAQGEFTLKRPAKASAYYFVLVDNKIYPTDGVRRQSTDTTRPSAQQWKVGLSDGTFYLAYKDFPNDIDPTITSTSNLYALDSKLYYLDTSMELNGEVVVWNNKMVFCNAVHGTFSSESQIIMTHKHCSSGTLIDVRGLAKKILSGSVATSLEDTATTE